MNTAAYKAIYKHFGLLAVLHELAISAIEKIVCFRIFIVYVHDELRPLDTAPLPGLDIHELSREELYQYTESPRHEMPRPFIDKALAKGNRCFGAFIDGQLCAFAWYAENPTVHSVGVRTVFDPQYVYSYKSLTLTEYRGNHLVPRIKNHALAFFQKRGKRGIICTIASNNFRSRRSAGRVGARPVGYYAYFMAGTRFFGFNIKGCRRLGYRQEQTEYA
jgi:hypothetical protein